MLRACGVCQDVDIASQAMPQVTALVSALADALTEAYGTTDEAVAAPRDAGEQLAALVPAGD